MSCPWSSSREWTYKFPLTGCHQIVHLTSQPTGCRTRSINSRKVESDRSGRFKPHNGVLNNLAVLMLRESLCVAPLSC
jgi:hypothetical protein